MTGYPAFLRVNNISYVYVTVSFSSYLSVDIQFLLPLDYCDCSLILCFMDNNTFARLKSSTPSHRYTCVTV